MSAPTRPALRYLGGKWRLAPWIIENLPPHDVYVEPFGGAASVLLRKDRIAGEVYNDLSGDLVNLFQVLRDEAMAARLCALVEMTPFAREEYDAAFEVTDEPVERARRLVVRSFMGHGSSAATSQRSTGFRANFVNRSGMTPAGDWASLPPALKTIHERFKGVTIERRPALQVFARYDGSGTLTFADPPYLSETRSAKRRGDRAYHSYEHEMTDDEHVEMLAAFVAAKGMVVLAGYPSRLYDEALAGWRRLERAAHADGALDRTEVLWINPAAVAALDRARAQMALFAEAAE